MPIIRLDLTALTLAGALSADEAARLAALAMPDPRGGRLLNMLLIFGAISVAAGAIALVPNASTGLLLALLALGGAEGLRRASAGDGFQMLSAGLATMGTLGLAGWVAWQYGETGNATAIAGFVTLVLAAGAIWFRSAFLAALGVVALGGVFGSGTHYWHASYALFVEEPVMTIGAFSLLAALLYRARDAATTAWQTLLTVAARTAIFLVQLGFWVGSLWGDVIGDPARSDTAVSGVAKAASLTVPDWGFALGWAAFNIALAMATRRGGFLLTTAIVFLAIHGYTQYFEYFGANPETLLIGGAVLVTAAVTGATYLQRARRPAA